MTEKKQVSATERKNIKVHPDVHHQADMESTRLGMPLYTFAEIAIASYVKLSQGKSTVAELIPPPERPAVSPEEQEYMNAAIYMLRESNADVRDMVKAVLKPGLGKLKKNSLRERKTA